MNTTEFEKWAILTYSNNRAIINEKKGTDKGIDGTAFILHSPQETREVVFFVKSGHLGVSQIRDLLGVIERENAAIGILIVLEEPTKPMLQEFKQAGVYENGIMRQSFERLQIVTVKDILEGKKLCPPLPCRKSSTMCFWKTVKCSINGGHNNLFGYFYHDRFF